MSILTKEEKENLTKKLEYIGLDLDALPAFLSNAKPLEYMPVRGYEEAHYKVYRYVPVNKIQILCTKANRLDALEEKYKKAKPLLSYLRPETEEDVWQYTTFLRMLTTVTQEQIQKIENEQEQLQKAIPFKVKYRENYLWQVYYSPISDQYFMLLPTEDEEYAGFFYLLKKQIEAQKTEKEVSIFLPICCAEYSGEYLKRTDLKMIENYLWLFTGEWPFVYEVYDSEGHMHVQIVGDMFVYEKCKSTYKIDISVQEEALMFFKLLKALFIMQTEIPKQYTFSVKISPEGGIEFWYRDSIITYQDLTSFVEKEYHDQKVKIEQDLKEIQRLETDLIQVKEKVKQQEREFLAKEKEIALYLQCKKSFMGKVKYFLGRRKLKKKEAIDGGQTQKQEEEKQLDSFLEELEQMMRQKQFYTIEDLVKIAKYGETKQNKKRNMELDYTSLLEKTKQMDRKIANATIYIDEIDKHNRSIFDFWQFTNQEENKALPQGEGQEENTSARLEKTFCYEEDLEEVGTKVDRGQRRKLSKEECDAIYVAGTKVLLLLNQFHNSQGKDLAELTKQREEMLENLKKEATQEKTFFEKEDFDIFGGMESDKMHIQVLSGKKHREVNKNLFKILDITRNTKIDEFEETLEKIEKNLQGAMQKVRLSVPISVYQMGNKEPNIQNFGVYHIKPEEAIKERKAGQILYRLNLKTDMSAALYTNIMYYDNYNQTLPEGMDVSEKLLFYGKEDQLGLSKETYFRINNYDEKQENQTETILVKEYAVRKEEKKDE